MGLWEDKKLYDRLMDMYQQRKKGYVKFNKARKSITEYFRPDLGTETQMNEHGDAAFFGENIYDGTAPWAADVMARGFQGNLVSATSDWIQYAMAQTELKDIDELDIWLQSVKEHMSDVYQRGNLYTVLPPFTLDGITIGSPVMFIDEEMKKDRTGTSVIKFLPQHYETVFLFYDKYNQPDGLIVRDKTWTVKQLADTFAPTEAEQKTKLSKSSNNAISEGKYYVEKTVYRAVFRGDNAVWNVEGFKKPAGEWVSAYFEEKPEEERKNEPLRTEQYFSRPFVVWDYDKKPYESCSRTPAFSAIYDVLSQQQTAKALQENNDLKNRPPRAVLEDHYNVVDFGPEGITPVSRDDWNFLPQMIDAVGDIRLTKEQLESGASRIKRWFKTENFLKFTDLTNTLRQQPSVDQNFRIAAELAVQLNPAIGTFTGEFLRSVDNRAIDIEVRAGRGPFAPDIMENITDIVLSNTKTQIASIAINPVFVGPLAREQKTKQELDPILTAMSVLAPLFEMDPDLKHTIRGYGTVEDILKAVNFPLKNLVPEEEFNEIIAKLNEIRAQQQQAEQALEMAKAAPSVSGAVDETSVLAQAGV